MDHLTENDRKLLVMAWQCFKSTPQVDYTALQTLGSYKTTASATACYLAARKKLLAGDNGAKMTANDRALIVKAWQCFKEQPTVDYKLLQEKGGYKNTASATACYLAVRKKLLGGEGAGKKKGPEEKGKGETKGRKRVVGKKAKAEEMLEDDKGGEEAGQSGGKRIEVGDGTGEATAIWMKGEVKKEDNGGSDEESVAASGEVCNGDRVDSAQDADAQ